MQAQDTLRHGTFKLRAMSDSDYDSDGIWDPGPDHFDPPRPDEDDGFTALEVAEQQADLYDLLDDLEGDVPAYAQLPAWDVVPLLHADAAPPPSRSTARWSASGAAATQSSAWPWSTPWASLFWTCT